jgi:hypothetical protein
LQISAGAPTRELSPGEKAALDDALAAGANDDPVIIIRKPDFAGPPESEAWKESRENARAGEDDEWMA